MTMEKLTCLTKKQQAQLAVVRDKWLAVGLGTTTDFEAAKRHIVDAYAVASLKPPSLWITLPSPLHGAIGSATLSKVGAQVRAQVGAQVRDQVWDQVWDQVGDQVGDQVRDQVRDQVQESARRLYGNH